MNEALNVGPMNAFNGIFGDPRVVLKESEKKHRDQSKQDCDLYQLTLNAPRLSHVLEY